MLFNEYFHGDNGAGLGAIAPDRLDRAGRRPDLPPARRTTLGAATPVSIAFGRQVCGDLDGGRRARVAGDRRRSAATRWAPSPGLRTRRYHGLLVVRGAGGPARRMLGLAALDPVVVVGDRRDPAGHPRVGGRRGRPARATSSSSPSTSTTACRAGAGSLGDVVLERELAMAHGRPAVGVVHRAARGPRPVRLELTPLCTWRDAHGERFAAATPAVEHVADGFVVRGRLPGRGPGWTPGGEWYRGVHPARRPPAG